MHLRRLAPNFHSRKCKGKNFSGVLSLLQGGVGKPLTTHFSSPARRMWAGRPYLTGTALTGSREAMERARRLLSTKKPIRAAFAAEREKKKRPPNVPSAEAVASLPSLPRLFHVPIAGGRAWNGARGDFARYAGAKALFRFTCPSPCARTVVDQASSRERA